MVYSNKYSQNINVSSYKDKSPTKFHSSKQNFEKVVLYLQIKFYLLKNR